MLPLCISGLSEYFSLPKDRNKWNMWISISRIVRILCSVAKIGHVNKCTQQTFLIYYISDNSSASEWIFLDLWRFINVLLLLIIIICREAWTTESWARMLFCSFVSDSCVCVSPIVFPWILSVWFTSGISFCFICCFSPLFLIICCGLPLFV